MRITIVQIAALVAAAGLSHAVETKTWEHSSREDFLKGRIEKLSLRSDGRLFLAPAIRQLLDASVASLWAAAEDSRGDLYVGGGGLGSSTAKLFRITPDGNSETVAELEGLEVQAIAIDSSDRVYAATSPDGKVYRIGDAGDAEVFYDPGAKYIWAMAFNAQGDLLVGTGDRGEVHRVSQAGEGSVFFRTEETHVRALAIDSADNVIVGTDPGGLIIRISPGGDGFVLYQSPKREVTTVAVAPDGTIYGAAVGIKSPARVVPPSPTSPPPGAAAQAVQAAASPAPPDQQQATTVQQQAQPAPAAFAGARVSVVGGSEVYGIASDGQPRTLWSDAQEIVYSLTVDEAGRPVFGTGNDGRVYRLDSDQLHTLLLDVPPGQVTVVQQGREGRLYVLTGNVGMVYQAGPGLEPEGSYESEVMDAGYFSYWGHLNIRGEAAGGTVRIEARSGNLDRPQQNWSPWSAVGNEDGGRIAAPSARFLQYRLAIASAGGSSPQVGHVDVAYLHKNVAPAVDAIEITPPNFQFPAQGITIQPNRTLALSSMTGPRVASPPQPPNPSPALSMLYAKGSIGARWLASDDNNDELEFTVEIRGEEEPSWKLVEDELDRPNLSWDSTPYPDGEYRLRVTASDHPANPPRQALTAQLVSDPFQIDNTPPAIGSLTASGATIRWTATDAVSVIAKAEYSLDGGDWTIIEPVSRLSDERQLDYLLELDNLAEGEHTVAVRVTDRFENQGVAQVIVR